MVFPAELNAGRPSRAARIVCWRAVFLTAAGEGTRPVNEVQVRWGIRCCIDDVGHETQADSMHALHTSRVAVSGQWICVDALRPNRCPYIAAQLLVRRRSREQVRFWFYFHPTSLHLLSGHTITVLQFAAHPAWAICIPRLRSYEGSCCISRTGKA